MKPNPELLSRALASFGEAMKAARERANRNRVCRWCGNQCRALTDNGVIGPGYRVTSFVCNSCGKVQ